jgi:hypothetical protein
MVNPCSPSEAERLNGAGGNCFSHRPDDASVWGFAFLGSTSAGRVWPGQRPSARGRGHGCPGRVVPSQLHYTAGYLCGRSLGPGRGHLAGQLHRTAAELDECGAQPGEQRHTVQRLGPVEARLFRGRSGRRRMGSPRIRKLAGRTPSQIVCNAKGLPIAVLFDG